jgi:hypothetical protein
MKQCGGFRGFTGSVDPSILMEPMASQSQLKSSSAFHFLINMTRYVEDVVAEVTMTKETIDKTYELIKLLSSAGIYSSLTAIDINKNYGYDFSAYSSEKRLIRHSRKLEELYDKLMSDKDLLIHMKDIILPELFKNIDSTYDCMMSNLNIHNLTIDADGSLRTCLRIRGEQMNKITDQDLLLMHPSGGYVLNYLLGDNLVKDRRSFCKWCNHTCVMMSKYVDDTEEQNKLLDHGGL